MSVDVFFYGSYIDREVLAEVDLVPEDVSVACVSGFDIRIGSLANLVPSHEHSVYGIVVRATHEELGFPDWYVAKLESFRSGRGP